MIHAVQVLFLIWNPFFVEEADEEDVYDAMDVDKMKGINREKYVSCVRTRWMDTSND